MASILKRTPKAVIIVSMSPSSPRASRLLLAILPSLVGPGVVAGQQPSLGPLTSEEGAPLQRVAYTAMMEGAEVLGRGRFSADFRNGLANIFEQDSSATHVLFLDMERLLTTLALRWGASETIDVGARVTFETTSSGSLDGAILAWHNLWGFGNANRDRFPEGVYRQTLRNGEGDVFLEEPRRTLGLDELRLFGKWNVVRSVDERSLLSLKLETRIPRNATSGADERADAAVMALGRLGVGGWYLHGMLGGAVHQASPQLEPILKGGGLFLTVALERSLGSRIAALVQLEAQSATLRTFEHRELDRAPTNLVLGLAGRIGESWRWDASFQEDVPADTPAIDFTIGLSLRRIW